jgi:asparagine synthase (glutamine-hydrolysing)
VPFLNRAIDLQFRDWLPDVILMKQDKLAMAHGVEARVPFLDHELVEYALRIPPRMKIRGFTSKAILRRYAADLLPKATRKRRKMPFYVPVEKYFEQPVFENLVADVLSEKTIRERGFFRPEAVARLKQEIHRGEFMHVKQVLSLAILELWLRMAVDRRGRL